MTCQNCGARRSASISCVEETSLAGGWHRGRCRSALMFLLQEKVHKAVELEVSVCHLHVWLLNNYVLIRHFLRPSLPDLVSTSFLQPPHSPDLISPSTVFFLKFLGFVWFFFHPANLFFITCPSLSFVSPPDYRFPVLGRMLLTPSSVFDEEVDDERRERGQGQ